MFSTSLFLPACIKNESPQNVTLSFLDALYNSNDPEEAAKFVLPADKKKLQNMCAFIDGFTQYADAGKTGSFAFQVMSNESIIGKERARIDIRCAGDSSDVHILLQRQTGHWLIILDSSMHDILKLRQPLIEKALEKGSSTMDPIHTEPR